jgi:hypothetical protein
VRPPNSCRSPPAPPDPIAPGSRPATATPRAYSAPDRPGAPDPPRRSPPRRSHGERPTRPPARPTSPTPSITSTNRLTCSRRTSGTTTQTDTCSRHNPGKSQGRPNEKAGLEAHRANRPTRLRSPNKAPGPDRPTLRPAPDRAFTEHFHAAKRGSSADTAGKAHQVDASGTLLSPVARTSRGGTRHRFRARRADSDSLLSPVERFADRFAEQPGSTRRAGGAGHMWSWTGRNKKLAPSVYRLGTLAESGSRSAVPPMAAQRPPAATLDHFSFETARKGSDDSLCKGENRGVARLPKPSAGLEPATPSLPWKCSTN